MRAGLAAASILALGCFAGAQGPPTTVDVMRTLKANAPSLVTIARCRAVACADAAFRQIRNPGEIAMLTYNSKLASINPSDRAAALGLLRSLPKNDAEATGLSSTDSFLFTSETMADIDVLGRVYWDLNQRAASALKLWPNLLAKFIRYGEIAFTDPHNDYANWAAKICRANPKRFLHAFWKLSLQDQCYFSHRVLDPHGCKQLAFPEGD